MPTFDEGFRAGYGVGYRDGLAQASSLYPESVRASREKTRRMSEAIKKKRRAGKKDPKMAKALRKANSMMRTKSGKLRKGKTQADVMRKAHQLRRKM